MSIVLTNARIASFHRFSESGEEFDEIHLTYQSIETDWTSPSLMTQDDWQAQAS